MKYFIVSLINTLRAQKKKHHMLKQGQKGKQPCKYAHITHAAAHMNTHTHTVVPPLPCRFPWAECRHILNKTPS